ncbi:MAG: hypothetical protein WBP31_05725 [Chitinophagales bacterium]|nr:hypothetical protein [Chitinophagales bacterium]
MKKQLLLFAAALIAGATMVKAQTNTYPLTGSAGLGTTTPTASALLDMTSTSQGLLAPRMTKAQRDAIASPATGLLIFQTNSTPGFYYYTGTSWNAISTKGANTSLSNLAAGGTAINVGLTPATNNTIDLGSVTNNWNEVYVNSIKFMDGTTQSTATVGGGGGVGGSGTTNYLPKFTAASTVGNSSIHDNSGYVGINTTAMIGSANFVAKSNNVTSYGGMYIDMAGTSGRKPFYGYAVGGLAKAWTYYDEATSQFRLYNGGDQFVVDNTGQIGIGTLTPSAKLNVETTGTSAVMKVTKPWTGVGATNFNLVEISNAYTFGYGTGLQASGGQIGVKGVASNGAETGYGVYGSGFGAAGTTYGVYGTAGSTAGTSIGVYGIATSGTSQYAGYFVGRGYFSGSLGIGTSTPDVKLHIEGGTDAELASGGFGVFGSTTSLNIAMDNNEIMARNNGATSTLYLNNDGGDVSMCYAGGNVMIGASVPATGYLLSVDGKVMCEELKVQMSGSWPDYVFADDYTLPTLYELEASIKQNKHLPGIPSAAVVEAEGIEVGAMQVQMMEKIEELTLYIIELQKQIDALKAE